MAVGLQSASSSRSFEGHPIGGPELSTCTSRGEERQMEVK